MCISFILFPRSPRLSPSPAVLTSLGFAVLWAATAHGQIVAKPAASAEKTSQIPAVQVLKYDDGTAENKRSLGASGHAVQFQRPSTASFIEAIEIFATRYGEPEPPKDYFHAYVLNEKRQVLADLPFPYSMIQRDEDLKWYVLRTPSIEVPSEFYIALAFNPHQTKGISLGLDDSVSQSHSLAGLPDEEYEPLKDKQDWMVRVHISDKPSGEKGVRRLSDWKPPRKVNPFAGSITIPAKVATSQEKQSYGGRGPAIDFKLDPMQLGPNGKGAEAKDILVKGFSVYGSRYGSGYDAATTFVKVAVIDSEGGIRWQGQVPYSAFNYKPQWVNIVLSQPIALSEFLAEEGELRLALDPEAAQTRGIYFHYQKNPPASHSLAGTIEKGFSPTSDREWLIRVHLEIAGTATPGTKPALRD